MSCKDKKHLKASYYNIGGDIVTVCLLSDCSGKVVARGLTIKSPYPQAGEELDPPRQIAKRRALRALKGRTVPPVRRMDIIRHLLAIGCEFLEKAYVNPKLSTTEKEILAAKKKTVPAIIPG